MTVYRHFSALALTCLLSANAVADELETQYESGARALAQGSLLAAIDELRSVARQDPGYRNVLTLLGKSYLSIGDHRAAKQVFDRALELRPNDGEATLLLGFSLYQEARYFEAARALGRAVELSPGHPLPRMYHGLSLLNLGQVEQAREELEVALQLVPHDRVARGANARLDLAVGNYSAAETAARDLLREQPDDVETLILLGRVLMESGRAADAIAPLRRAADSVGTARSDVLYLLAQAQLRSGNREAGEETLKLFELVKEKEERLRLLRATVSTDPGNMAARAELVRLLQEFGLNQLAQLHRR